MPSSGDGPCLHLATGLAFIWRRALPSSGDGPCLHLATGLAFIWRRARIHRQRIRARPHRRGPSGGQDRDRIRRPKARPPTPGLKRRRGPGRGAGTCLAFIWRRALPSSGDGPCLHLATGLAFIWRRARIHRQRIRARPHRRGPSGGQDRDRIRRPKARPPTPGLKRRRGPGRGAGTCQS